MAAVFRDSNGVEVPKRHSLLRIDQYTPRSIDPGAIPGVGPIHKTSMRGEVGQRSEVSKALEGLSDGHNPYSRYGDGESLDDGIFEGLTSPTTTTPNDIYNNVANGVHNDKQNDHPSRHDQIPDENDVLREFADYMEVMCPMSEPEEVALKNTNTAEKWQLICNQKQRSPIFNIRYYIENLRQNQGTKRKKFSVSKKSHSSSLSYLLRKLKLDLRMSATSFLYEFSAPPNDGMKLLLGLLRSMQVEEGAMQTNRRTRMDDYKRLMDDESDCLLCIKFLSRTEEAKQLLFREDGIVDLCIGTSISLRSKSRATALQLLSSLVRTVAYGYQRVLEGFRRQRQLLNESALCRTLCTLLGQADDPADVDFKLSAVNLFNALMTSLPTANARVHLQYELDRAGFNPDQLYKFSYGDQLGQEDLGSELDTWKKHWIDVTTTQEEVGVLEERNVILRDEVTRLQQHIKTMAKSTRQQERENRRVSEKRDDYRERAAELQDTVAKLTKLYSENTGKPLEETVNVDAVLKPLDQPAESVYGDRYATGSLKSDGSTDTSFPVAPPLPPPAPPITPPKRKLQSSTSEMPLLNWTPIHTVANTIFQDLDEAVYTHIDFKDFESRFKLQRRSEAKGRQQKWQQTTGESLKLLFVNMNRAKNLCITKHRTGLTSRQISEAIERCDVKTLPGEYAELLMKFTPTKEELKMLAQHREEYRKMGEAEQFLFQLAQVERLESKLSLLTFIGIFDELLQSVRPHILQVLEASRSVLKSKGLKKLFEIILVFGNYMNGSKRGYTMGFRLESLYRLGDVKTVDKQHTLLHYLAEQVRTNYPEILNYSDSMDLKVNKGASFHAMLQDVKGLRKGLDLVKFEKEKQVNNPVLERFYVDASRQVASVAENFKRMEELYKEVCCTYGENYKQIEPDVFFGTLADFNTNFKKACNDNTRRSRPVSSRPSSTIDASPRRTTSPKPLNNISTKPVIQVPKVPKKNTVQKVQNEVPRPAFKDPPKLLPRLALKTDTSGAKFKEQTPPSGPITGNHDIMTSHKFMVSSSGVKTENKLRKLSVKKTAPAPPPLRTSTPGTNGVPVTPPSGDDNHTSGDRSAEARPRFASEPSSDDVMAALGQLDLVVDYEEHFGISENETLTSYL